MIDQDYSIDIVEIKTILSIYFADEVESLDASLSITKMTEPTNENYLNCRGIAIDMSAEKDTRLKKLMGHLASLCAIEKCNDCPVCKYCNHYINVKRCKIYNNALKMVDLFCGAGGLSLGFAQEGFVTVLANDIEDCCVDTYAHNHPEIPRSQIIKGDINEMINNLDSYIKDDNVSIVVGGPPCQGFSMANRQRLIDDPRNHLYRSYVKVVETIRPPFFVMENVKGMLSVANQVIDDFKSIGYSVSAQVLNAKDFGVPQNRERLIYIGNCLGIDNDIIFEELASFSNTANEHVLQDALYGLVPLVASREKNATEKTTVASGGKITRGLYETNDYIDLINQGRVSNIVYNHKARYNNDRDIEIFGRLNPGDRSDDPKIADIMPYSRRNGIFKDKYFKLEPNKICKTITAHMKFDCNMYIHPFQARGLTPREAARIQSFPDSYYFRGAYTKTYMQIGNSVPPLLSRAIAHTIKKYLRGD